MGDAEGKGDSVKLQLALLSSSTSLRINTLEEVRQRLDQRDASTKEVQALLPLLLETIPRYSDRNSRRAVQNCIRTLLRKPEFAAPIVKSLGNVLKAESSKNVIATTNAFVILEWASLATQEAAQDPALSKTVIPDLSNAAAKSLEKCLHATSRPSVAKSALVVARRGLRNTLRSSNSAESALESLVPSLTAGSGCRENAPYLGVVAGVCERLPTRKEAFQNYSKTYVEFYKKEIVGSKTLVSPHVAAGLHDFFAGFVDQSQVNEDILPSFEKAILRSPEVVLGAVLPSLLKSIPKSFDVSEAVSKNLAKPLLSSLTSTNPIIKNGACQSFESLLSRCHEGPILDKVAEQVIASLKASKPANTELRGLLARVIQAFPDSAKISSMTAGALGPLALKESNETAAEALVSSFCHELTTIFAKDGIPDASLLDILKKGCQEKRLPIRRLWHLKVGQLLWTLKDREEVFETNEEIFKSVLQTLQSVFSEVVSTSTAQAQPATISSALVFTALTNLDAISLKLGFSAARKNACAQALSIKPKPSFLLSSRTYTRFTTDDDLIWCIRALSGVSSQLANEPEDCSLAWAQAYLFILAANGISPQVRAEAGKSLSSSYLDAPGQISKAVVKGIWQWLEHLALSTKDSAAVSSKSGTLRLYLAVRSICPPKDATEASRYRATQETLESQLVQLQILLRPQVMPRVKWIEMCLRTGLDPGSLGKAHAAELFENITKIFDARDAFNISMRTAACDAAAELAFVSPEESLPLIKTQISIDLDPTLLSEMGPIEAAIAQTPEGVAFIDVLSNRSSNAVENKNVKDYKTLKWEEELRAQVAQKKGQQKKLTADEQGRVSAQLAKEAVIRENVKKLQSKIQRGAGLVGGMATGPPTDVSTWINDAVFGLLKAAEAGACHFDGGSIAKSFLELSNLLASRLGVLRLSIGAASLRASYYPLGPELEEEPLGELVTRVLYRLRFASEQRPFDVVTFSYALPLVFKILSRNALGYPAGEDADAQVLLALEFLSFHMDSCENLALPRAQILSVLVESMSRYAQHHRLIKDSLGVICRCIAANIERTEINVLLAGATSPDDSVKIAVLQSIDAELDLSDMPTSKEIWLLCHDELEEATELALTIWEESSFKVNEDLIFDMMGYLDAPDAGTRRTAAKALLALVKQYPSVLPQVIRFLEEKYVDESKPLVPKKDKYGIIQKGTLVDHWEIRSGIASAFGVLSKVYQTDSLSQLMKFLIEHGPLADRHPRVRDEMVAAGTSLVTLRGKEALEPLMKMFEQTLESANKASKEADLVNEAVVVLYGSIARHLDSGDERVVAVIERLLATLSTPSESVQYAVAGCLTPLVHLARSETATFIQKMIVQLTTNKSYAARRGAAYGLAGLVAGRGITALKEYRVMTSLKSAAENKKSVEQRQGALFAYELFSLILGRTFEPYIIHILPQLLALFGDASADVREACLDTAKQCFSSLSSFGVKQILPQLLEGLDESQWRSKKGACDLLGAMAYLDPQQLAVSLPDIIPPLTGVLNDTHKEVRASANRSLQRFGDVISNPEIKSLVDILLSALSDPTKHTEEALDALIKVSFTHYLDAPSLALVVRILERGLSDRSATKRKASQIIGSLAHLTDKKDLSSHLPILVAGLRAASVDPVPATRATASKALGSLVEKLGEDALPDLIPSLMSNLRSETGAGDRLGSAQALSEVLAGLGTTRLEETLPTILQNVSSTKPTVREGFMTLFIFLPACFGNSFATYLNKIIPPILSGLADDVEAIRETALRAGRLLVKNFATKAIDLLLPELQRGLADDSYRIRLSSVELVGDLLFNLTGVSSITDAEEEGESAAQAGQSLLEILGEERRNRVLSSLYICRCDTSGLVRTAAVAVWKALVASPRTLKELVPTLSQLIISRLASSNMEQKVIASNALGEMIRKAGEGVLLALLPELEEGLQSSTDVDTRQGICIALRELIVAAAPESLEDHEKTLISVVRTALVDPDSDVREAAAEAFDSLQQILGKRAVDQVLPYLLSLLQNEAEAENALAALLTLLTESTRANIILPNLIPTLLSPPITAFNAKALASLAEVAGPAMTRRLPSIINNLVDNIVSAKTPELKSDLNAALNAVLSSVDEYDGLNTVMSVVLGLVKHEDHRKRAIADYHLATFFSNATVDYSRYNQDLIRVLLLSFNDGDNEVIKAAWTALNQLTSRLRKEEMESLVISTRQVLQQVGVPGHNLPGFGLPKGINAILPIFLQGLMNGTVDQRTQAAMAISEIIDRTSPESLKPFVTQITGPLIRVISERSVDVKCAILTTLNQLLEKIPLFVKPFLPQLQRTFTKCLADPSSDLLRSRAAKALGTLITLTPRVDPLIAELVTGSKTSDEGVKNAMLKGLQEVVSKAGSNMSETSREAILGLIDSQAGADSDTMGVTMARLFGGLIKVLPPTSALTLIKTRVLVNPPNKTSVLALNAVLADAPDALINDHLIETANTIRLGMTSSPGTIQDNCTLAAGKLLLSPNIDSSSPILQPLVTVLSESISPGHPIDLRRLSLVVIRTVSRHKPTFFTPNFLPDLAPPIFQSVRDPVIPIKLAAEAAFLELFQVVDSESEIFDQYMASPDGGASLPPGPKRSMQDYFKRVAMRLGVQARERREAEGGQGGLGLAGDEVEDEREIWSVGQVEIGNVFDKE
ncbi:putative translational activator gcn1 [Phaeomoniella chlamydospora]|uniref:eIF-2-alpha kinase activator GCN1 n=1 Tax=Phaeomoniella chlamydospora TaxID=158046 RepID=A0A0G2DUS4_PHACM|nr:putative translational activator gcn1 [Phaeomoniella chlamydospora]